MIVFKVTVAGVCFLIQTRYGLLEGKCRDFISGGEPDFNVCASREEMQREKESAETRISDSYAESLAVFRKMSTLAAEKDVLLMHGSAFSFDGKAVIITAPSGTGKSTHTALWLKAFGDRVRVINDDKPWLKRENGRFTVYGTPWMGKSNLGENISAPLCAVCVLHRAEENSVTPCTKKIEALLSQIFRPADVPHLRRVLNNICLLEKETAIYDIYCNMEEDAANAVARALFGEVKNEA